MLPMVSVPTWTVSLAAEPPKTAESPAVHAEIGASTVPLSQFPDITPVPSQTRSLVVVLSLAPLMFTVLPSQNHVVAPRAVLRPKAGRAPSGRGRMMGGEGGFCF